MQIPAFRLSAIPDIVFANGARRQLPALINEFGRQVLVVTGASAFTSTPCWTELKQQLQAHGIAYCHAVVSGEPSPQMVDAMCHEFRQSGIDVVVGIGGGSVLDAAKAVAGLLSVPNSVMDFLEGVGPELPYPGTALPFIALPTTAGTGSEATKNAVLSRQGKDGFKKSFRHDSLVPRYAVVDPELLATCPPALIAANGMDAFTQLLESYVSTRANPITDALAMSGIRAVRDSLLPWYDNAGDVAQHRANMAYAAMLSGITLAQVGLGSVHGLAAPLGAFFPMPHGVVCGTLVAACTHGNIAALQNRGGDGDTLWRYAHVGKVLVNNMQLSALEGLDSLLQVLDDWTRQLQLPRLANFGMTAGDIDRVVANCRGSSMKTNPVMLSDAELSTILKSRL